MAITLLESAFPKNLGFDVKQNDDAIAKDAYWFGESQSRIVVSVAAGQSKAFEEAVKLSGIKFSNLGTVTSGEIITDSEAWGNIFAWKDLYDNALSGFLQNREGEVAFNMI